MLFNNWYNLIKFFFFNNHIKISNLVINVTNSSHVIVSILLEKI